MIKPNHLTVFRILLAFICPPLLLHPNGWSRLAAVVVFGIACLTDLWDGSLARRIRRETRSGKILDPIADKILILGSMGTLAYLRVYPFWILLPIFLREILVTAIRIRCLARDEVIAAELSGKIKTAVQIASVFLSCFYLLARDHQPWTVFVPLLAILNYVFILLALFITVYSGYLFFVSNRFQLLIEVLATCFYAGYLQKFPGTFGSLAGLAFLVLCHPPPALFLILLVTLIGIAVWSSGLYAENAGSKDPAQIVIDEWVGILVTFAGISLSWRSALLGFLLFRIFDIAKPFPLRRIEKWKKGWGIVMDDVAAGLYANVTIRLASLLLKI